MPLQWCHNERNWVSNHRGVSIVCSIVGSGEDLRKHQSSASLAIVGGISEFPTQKASSVENVSIWWRHHGVLNIYSQHLYYNFLKRSVCILTSISLMYTYIPCNPFDSVISNTLRPKRNRRHFADAIFKSIFLNENVWSSIKISLKFVPKGLINKIPALVQIMAGPRPGDKPLSEAMMVRLQMHICITWPWLDYWCIYASLGLNESIKLRLLSHLRVLSLFCPACRTFLIATRFWVVVICPIIKCLTVLEFSFILFDLCLFITIFNFILNYVPIVTFWIFT